MQTKKKVSGRHSHRELGSPKASRQQYKISENMQNQDKKVKDLITSSTRKQKPDYTFSKKTREHVAATNLNFRCEAEAFSFRNNTDTIINASMNHLPMDSDNGNAHCMADSIFSPTFHMPRNAGGMDAADMVQPLKSKENQLQDCGKENLLVDFSNTHMIHGKRDHNEEAMNHTFPDLECSGLSPEVSAIYLSMKNSKLECFDEYNQDVMSANVCMEVDEYEEYEDFDPYFFIKNLPDLSTVVPTFRSMLLPKQTRSCPSTTLVLDLDETLVHSTLEPCDDADFKFSVNFNMKEHSVFVRCRPFLKDFLERVSGLFEIIIFTASQSIYAEQLLNVLDPKRKVFRHRVYRESCVFVEGNYLKDLSVLGRDLAHVIIIDNSPQAFGFQVDNGIPIESWFDDRSDKELLLLLPFLESLVDVEDVRPMIAKKFNLREKITAAVCPLYSDRDLFAR